MELKCNVSQCLVTQMVFFSEQQFAVTCSFFNRQFITIAKSVSNKM